jgi:hypothetical protein
MLYSTPRSQHPLVVSLKHGCGDKNANEVDGRNMNKAKFILIAVLFFRYLVGFVVLLLNHDACTALGRVFWI